MHFNFDTIVLHQVYWNSIEELYFINKYDIARKIYPISGRLLAILINIFITPDEVRTNACIPLSNWTITPFVVLAIVCPPFLSIVAGSISGNLELQLELIFQSIRFYRSINRSYILYHNFYEFPVYLIYLPHFREIYFWKIYWWSIISEKWSCLCWRKAKDQNQCRSS